MTLVFILSLLLGMFYLLKDKTLFYVVLLYIFFVAKFLLLRFSISPPPAINYVLMFMMLFTYAIAKEKHFKVVGGFLFFYILFFLFKALISDVSFFTYINTYKTGFIFWLGGIALLDNINRRSVDMRRLLTHLKIILAIQVIFSWAQYLIPQIQAAMKVEGYTWNGVDVVFGFDRVMKSSNMMFGLLFSPTNLSIFMAMTTGGIVSYMFYKNVFKIKDIALITVSIVTIFFTGVRAPFMVVVFILLALFYYYK